MPDLPAPLDFIHWFLPGPDGATTPIIGLPAMGLNVEPSTLTDFDGYTAFAVVSGEAEGSDGNNYGVEFDVRVMQGKYRVDSKTYHGTFAFI